MSRPAGRSHKDISGHAVAPPPRGSPALAAGARLNVVYVRECVIGFTFYFYRRLTNHTRLNPRKLPPTGKFPKRMHAGPGHRGAPDSLVSTRTTGANKFDPRAYWYPRRCDASSRGASAGLAPRPAQGHRRAGPVPVTRIIPQSFRTHDAPLPGPVRRCRAAANPALFSLPPTRGSRADFQRSPPPRSGRRARTACPYDPRALSLTSGQPRKRPGPD